MLDTAWSPAGRRGTMRDRRRAMIELTEPQSRALDHRDTTPPQMVNPRTNETYVLLRVDEYERLKAAEYDDSPWTRDELQTLAWEAGKSAVWDDTDEYDNLPEKP
jgi:hypothetical protein